MACTFPQARPIGLEAHCYSNAILLLFAVSFLNTPSFLHVGNSVTHKDALGIHCITILAENDSRPSQLGSGEKASAPLRNAFLQKLWL